MITVDDVRAARDRIAGYVRRTPVIEAAPGLWFKLEYLQHTASFKPRGAVNRLVATTESGELDPAVGVVAASGGNHGLAVAYAAGRLGVPAEVWVPRTAPAVKVAALRALGAEVVLHGSRYAEAYEGAVKRAADRGAVYCHAYDQPEVAAGNGTVGLELAEHRPDTVLVAVGGGGLAAGIAAALEGRATVVAVEPVASQALHAALAAGRPVDVPVGGVAADSLGAPRVGDIAYAVAVRTGMSSVVVPDEAITAAQTLLWEELRLVAEPGGATALAALVCGAYKPAAGERVAVVVCGGNTDPAGLAGLAPAPETGTDADTGTDTGPTEPA